MEPEFWHTRWQRGEIGFHEGHPNELFLRHFASLFPAPARVFVPLCGKAVDLHWLRDHGYEVVGVELNQDAVTALFAELGDTPAITDVGPLRRYAAPGITVDVGDIFDLGAGWLGGVDVTYDRAALVALPTDLRHRYARHLTEITRRAPQLLLTFVYEPGTMNGPPFSIDASEIATCYGDAYTAHLIDHQPAPSVMFGSRPVDEQAWHLVPAG